MKTITKGRPLSALGGVSKQRHLRFSSFLKKAGPDTVTSFCPPLLRTSILRGRSLHGTRTELAWWTDGACMVDGRSLHGGRTEQAWRTELARWLVLTGAASGPCIGCTWPTAAGRGGETLRQAPPVFRQTRCPLPSISSTVPAGHSCRKPEVT